MPSLAGRSLTSTTMNCLPVTAPLLDWDLASLAYQLPIRKRLGRRFHREWMTRLNPQMACCASTNRVSTAWSKEALLFDPPRYVADLSLRLANKLSARFLGKAFLHDSPDHLETRPRVRRSANASALLKNCIEAGLLSDELEISDLRSGDLGRILCLGSLLNFLAKASDR